jgi:hypothetical protein
VIGNRFSLGEHLTLPVEERVLRLVAKMRGIERGKLSLTTRLFHDLEVWGDDAQELLLAFADEFEVDFSGFEFSDYFKDEAGNGTFWQWAAGRKLRDEKLPLTVADLVAIAEAKAIKPLSRSVR